MKGFIGRKNELASLEELWNQPDFQMPILYGRRRVGKTCLLEQFSENKKAMFFAAGKNDERNRDDFLKMIREFGISCDSTDWRTMFNAVFSKAKEDRSALFIDEFPYMAKACPDITVELQHIIDKKARDSRLFLMLCGSSISFMKNDVLGYESPLHGRKTTSYDLQPFSVFESAEFLPHMDFEELCKIYGMIDGTPQYLKLMSDEAGFVENMEKKLLKKESYLFNEANGLLMQELEDPETHSDLLAIAADGHIKPSKAIAQMETMGVDKKSVLDMVKNLVDINIMKTEMPVGERDPKQMLLSINDLFFRFWHRFMPKASFPVENGRPDIARDYIMRNHPQYMGGVFEKICEQWVLLQNMKGNLPVPVIESGRWWGKDPTTKKTAEIDIVARDIDRNTIFCECKWQNEKVGPDVIQDLQRKSALVKKTGEKWFYVFSKSGFTDGCLEYAKKGECDIVSLDKMASSAGKNEKKRKTQVLRMRM